VQKLFMIVAVGFFFFMLWIIYLANTRTPNLFFYFVGSLPYGDKLGHFGLFGFLTFLSILGSNFKWFSLGKIRVYYGAAVVMLFAIVEEFSQVFIVSRTFDLADLAADTVGIVMAIACAYIVNRLLVKFLKKPILQTRFKVR